MNIGPKSDEVLKTRLTRPAQVSNEESLSSLPPYLDSFLAHLRLLIGVPFQYLIPDARELPDESIRFFYLDRSWTDRLVDGALAVGKVGTREQAHVQAHASAVQRSADDSETLVRDLQRRRITNYADEKRNPGRGKAPADTVTGFLLRSAMVSGWPHMEVRAFADNKPLPTLRLERLSPGVMIAFWRGVPDRVELEEPHHGVQFGVDPGDGGYTVFLRRPNGEQVTPNSPVKVQVPMRVGGRGVVHMTELRRRLDARRTQSPPQGHPEAITQSGPGAFAISLLNPPFRQPFSDTDSGPPFRVKIALRVADATLVAALRTFVGEDNG
jgi:hypothetical protein